MLTLRFIAVTFLAGLICLVAASLVGLAKGTPIDAVWFSLVPALLLLLFAFDVRLTPGRLFLVTSLPVAMFVLAYSLAYVDYSIVIVPDSGGYLQRVLDGTWSATRSIGYASILLAVQTVLGLDQLAWFQLGSAIACYLAGGYLLSVRFGSRCVAVLFAVAVLFQGTLSQYAPEVLTETLFTGALGLFAAAMGSLAWRPDRLAVAAAVAGIVLATLTKGAGIALIAPALLLVRFLPYGKRLSVVLPIVVAGLATYGVMVAHNYSRTGIAAPENLAGFALAGHVGGMLDDTSMPPSELSRKLVAAVALVIARRPAALSDIRSRADLDRYVDFTAVEYGTITWDKMYGTLRTSLGPMEEINAFLMRLAVSSIRAHPWEYLRHVAIHYYGLWHYMPQTMTLVDATAYVRSEPLGILPGVSPALVAQVTSTVLRPYRDEAALKGEAAAQSKLPLAFANFWNIRLVAEIGPMFIGTAALLLSILFLVPGQWVRLFRTEIMIALSLNAYFGAHVLFQVALPRYSSGGVIAAIYLVLSLASTSWLIFSRPFGGGRSRSGAID